MNEMDDVLKFCWCRDFSYNQTSEMVRDAGFGELSVQAWERYSLDSYNNMVKFFQQQEKQ